MKEFEYSSGLKTTCSAVPVSAIVQPNCVFPLPHVVEPLQQTGLVEASGEPSVCVVSVCVCSFAAVTVCGAARLENCTAPGCAFQADMFQSQMPYRLCALVK